LLCGKHPFVLPAITATSSCALSALRTRNSVMPPPLLGFPSSTHQLFCGFLRWVGYGSQKHPLSWGMWVSPSGRLSPTALRGRFASAGNSLVTTRTRNTGDAPPARPGIGPCTPTLGTPGTKPSWSGWSSAASTGCRPLSRAQRTAGADRHRVDRSGSRVSGGEGLSRYVALTSKRSLPTGELDRILRHQIPFMLE
jgi:hypothetical protein